MLIGFFGINKICESKKQERKIEVPPYLFGLGLYSVYWFAYLLEDNMASFVFKLHSSLGCILWSYRLFDLVFLVFVFPSPFVST